MKYSLNIYNDILNKMIQWRMTKKIILILSIFSIILISPFISSMFSDKGYVKLDKELQSTILDSYSEKNILVFFGYVGCVDICTPRLSELSSEYEKLKKKNIDVKVLFINLTKLKDHKSPDLFAKSFNKDFKGIYLHKDELESIKKELNVYSAPRIGESYEIDHTAFLFLFKKTASKYHLSKIYTKIPFHLQLDGNDL